MKVSAKKRETGGQGPQSAIFYGPPKSGKTFAAAQFSKDYNLLWLDCEKGYQTLFTAITDEMAEKVELVVVNDTQDKPNAVKTIGKLFTENRKHRICDEHGIIACPECSKNPNATYVDTNLYELDTSWIVVVDSLTQLSDSAIAHALGKVDTFDKKKVEYDHYDRQGLLLKNILTATQRLPCHTIFISHEEELEQEDGSKKLCPVGGTRNFSRKVTRYFDHCVYFEIKNAQHRANSDTSSARKYQAGSRNNVALEKDDDLLSLFLPKERSPDAKAPATAVKQTITKPASPGNALLQKAAASRAAKS